MPSPRDYGTERPRPLHWSIVVDFDGTISVGDFTDRLLERFALPQWREVEEAWKAGSIGSRECLLRQIDMVRCTPAEFAALADETQIDGGFAEFVAFCRHERLAMRIVSDGLDAAIAAILRRHGLDHLPVFANHLTHLGGDRYRIAFPSAREDCVAANGTCKCAVAGAGPRSPSRTLLIGDGASDFCVARAADFVLAKGRLAAFCAAEGLPYAEYSDFHDVRRLVAGLLGGGVMAKAVAEPDSNQETIRHE